MKLQDQVTNLEISKKLKELGVKQESLFWWWRDKRDGMPQLDGAVTHPINTATISESEGYEVLYSAFTVAELGEMLKPIKDVNKNEFVFSTTRDEIGLWAASGFSSYSESWEFEDKKYTEHELFFDDIDTEANARGKMLIYLLEQKLI